MKNTQTTPQVIFAYDENVALAFDDREIEAYQSQVQELEQEDSNIIFIYNEAEALKGGY